MAFVETIEEMKESLLVHGLHGMGNIVMTPSDFFALFVLDAAARTRPTAQTVAVLMNDADNAVNNDLIKLLIDRWRGQGQDVRVQAPIGFKLR